MERRSCCRHLKTNVMHAASLHQPPAIEPAGSLARRAPDTARKLATARCESRPARAASGRACTSRLPNGWQGLHADAAVEALALGDGGRVDDAGVGVHLAHGAELLARHLAHRRGGDRLPPRRDAQRYCLLSFLPSGGLRRCSVSVLCGVREGGREGGKEGGREEGRKGGRKRGREERREQGREG